MSAIFNGNPAVSCVRPAGDVEVFMPISVVGAICPPVIP